MGALGDAVAASNRDDRRDDDRAGDARDDKLLVGAARADLLERLSAGLVHEARNPLNAMAIHLEVLADKLRDEATGELPPHLARNLDSARNQVRRLDDLLRRWGEFSCERTAADEVGACARRAVGLCEYHLRRAGLEVALDVASGLCIRAPGLVCQALVELLLIAVGTTPSGTSLQLSGTLEGKTVCISIRGASAADEEVSRADGGLGEASVRAIVRELGGEIAHTAGEPWCWTLRLPRASASQTIVT